jgi:hypothetical protein
MKSVMKEICRGAIIALVSLSPLSLTGCGVGAPPPTEVGGGFMKGSADVSIITLQDGTRCAVLIGNRRGALDCNWK